MFPPYSKNASLMEKTVIHLETGVNAISASRPDGPLIVQQHMVNTVTAGSEYRVNARLSSR
jgi:hypothetical protein